MDQALLLLPHSTVLELFKIFPKLLENSYEVEVKVKVMLSLLKSHFNQLVSNSDLLPTLKKINKLASKHVSEQRVIIFKS